MRNNAASGATADRLMRSGVVRRYMYASAGQGEGGGAKSNSFNLSSHKDNVVILHIVITRLLYRRQDAHTIVE